MSAEVRFEVSAEGVKHQEGGWTWAVFNAGELSLFIVHPALELQILIGRA